MGKAYINGWTVEFMMESGKIILFMVLELIYGLMEGNMLVGISKRKNTDKVHFHGLVENSLVEYGTKVN